MVACPGHILKSTKGIEIKLDTYINVNECFNSSLCMHESVGMSTLTQLELGDKISLSFFFFCRSSSRNDKHSVQNNHQKQGT